MPNVGKSTLFKALTKNDILIANYPFATIDPNVGVVAVPDERVDILFNLSRSAKRIPAIVEFYDIAGLVKGASEGQGLGNKFLSHIRETNAIVHLVRCFKQSDIIHVENSIDPIRDIDTINSELILKDLDTIKKRLNALEAEARTGTKEKTKELELVKKLDESLGQEKPLYLLDKETLENPAVKSLNLLTSKPVLFLLNGSEEDVTEELKNKISQLKSSYITANLGTEVNLNSLIKKAYEILNLISFFTTGEDETRAWTIVNGWKAPQAAGTIHTDFENKFIRADVVFWKDLIDCGGWSQAKQKGLLRTEGKEYVMKDGDVIVVKHG